VTLETTRDDLLLSVIRGNLAYLGDHLREVAQLVTLGRKAGISGGGARIRGMIEARRRWTGDFDYVFQPQSSLLGAAMLGQMYQARTQGERTVDHPQRAAAQTQPRAVSSERMVYSPRSAWLPAERSRINAGR
jgi:hypothetical protein